MITQIFYAANANILARYNHGMKNNVVYWPELKEEFFEFMASKRQTAIIPLHPQEIIDLCPSLEGKSIFTLSEHVALYFLREIRLGRMKPDELQVYWVSAHESQQLRVDEDGEFLDRWTQGFFEERGKLLFD